MERLQMKKCIYKSVWVDILGDPKNEKLNWHKLKTCASFLVVFCLAMKPHFVA